MSCEDLCTRDAGLYTCGQGSGPCSLLCVRATTTREVSAVTKDYSLLGNYRPIALKNTLGKILEKIVVERI